MDRREFVSGLSALIATPAAVRSDTGGAIGAIGDYEAATGGHAGLYAHNLRSGQMLTWRANDRFVMCSTFKASLAACVLARADRGHDNLNTMIRYTAAETNEIYAPVAKANLATGALSIGAMCAAAVSYSDNTCANLLLARIGGPVALTAFWRSLGDPISRLDNSEPLLNRTPPGGVTDTTTPAAMAGVLRRLVLGPALSPASRTLLRGWLIGCKTGDARLRAGLPKGWVIGDKTGNNGKDAAGDIAIVWPKPHVPIIIATYTRGGSPTERDFAALFAGVGREVAARLA